MQQSITILIADDNPDDVFLLTHAFSKAGATPVLHRVTDGQDAIAYLKGDGAYADRTVYPIPDVLLLDLNMPRCSGFELLDWIRREPRLAGLGAHVLTASARPADVQRAYELGARSYVVKPTRLDDLIAFAGALLGWQRFVARAPIGRAQDAGRTVPE